jgi:hypothetical protein
VFFVAAFGNPCCFGRQLKEALLVVHLLADQLDLKGLFVLP